jgi:putative nucleotidyltransferase with HDIG domain
MNTSALPHSTVLVADDDFSIRKMIVDALQYAGRCSTIEASNGVEALNILQKHSCDIVITDVKMPVMSGMELLNRIMESNPMTHVIVMTGQPSIDLSVTAMKSGAVDFIVKPFKIDDLLYKVDISLREKTLLSEKSLGDKVDAVLKNKIKDLSTQSYIYDIIEDNGNSNEQIFHDMVDTAMKITGAESCSLLLFDEENNEFHLKVNKQLYENDNLSQSDVLDPALLRKVVHNHEGYLINPSTHPDIGCSYLIAPLKIRNRVFGVLNLSRHGNGLEFSQTNLNYILSLTRRASLNLENNILYESTYANLMDAFKSMAASIQARDHYTESHSIRVTKLSIKISETLGCCSPDDIESLKIAGMLHDIGKIAVPDHVLMKPDRLTVDEFDIIKQHPLTGEAIMKPIMLFERESIIIRHHHERWDGRGYPDGIAGENIPLLSRILAVADSFDAMTNNRPYRNAMPVEKAIDELLKNAGRQFDRDIVGSFLKIIGN